ncbi:hypothetical protein K439DRAFT_1622603 [Ramaria rubella]|nr:hypothetical protein K439DRAFT_1622603 [Ramaria rubella]
MAKGIPTKRALQPTPSANTSRAQRATAHAGKKSITETGSASVTADSRCHAYHARRLLSCGVKKGTGKSSADTEIISVHSSSPFVDLDFVLRQCTDICKEGSLSQIAHLNGRHSLGMFSSHVSRFSMGTRSLKREHTLSPVVKKEDDVEEENPPPSKKSKKQLQGIIPTSDEEPDRDITAANEGGWSDGSSLSGFIVDDDASLEMMTDSGNEAVSSGEVLPSSPPKRPANKGKGVQELQSQTIIDHTQMVDQERVLEAVGLLRSKDSDAQSAQPPGHPPEVDHPASSASLHRNEEEESPILQSPIRLSQTSQSHPPHTPKAGEQGASGSGASQATSSWDDNKPKGLILHNSYYRCMKEYQANRPAKCAILDDISDLSQEHRELLLDAPRWSSVIQWSTEYPSRLWTCKDFSEQLSVELPEQAVLWEKLCELCKVSRKQAHVEIGADLSAFGKSGSYVTDWQFNKGAMVNVLLGGVGLCKLIDHILLNSKLHHQICIYPLDGEWQRFVTMISTVYMTGSLEFNTYKGAIVIGTQGVNADKSQTNLAVSSKGKFASNVWSPSKCKAAVGQDKDKKKWANTMWGNAEVPIYDSRGLNIPWDNVEDMPRVSQDLDLDSVVLVAHTTSLYGDNNISLNVQFVVQIA